ncbi:TPA: hypothetical protein HA235_01620 [Candidatus Woesearchaeota archaeon]|nr:hypothetical protein [Candidatus Woesearchaeota archaeon]HIH54412.1 hypothetical protein [Candidatus Woesearchaeota archaeon]HIJ14132.1 hypothetical protein [Candidatus Woesearchaeota archaeon]
MNIVCPKCQSRGLTKCFCILRERIKLEKNISQNFKKEFFGENYNIFVGRYGYPNINVGLLSLPETQKDEKFDNPLLWAEQDYDINKIINLRTQMINANFKTDIKGSRLKELYQELSLSAKPVDTEIKLEKPPSVKINFNAEATPFGPSIKLEQARITENVSVPNKVENVVNDDLTATESLNILYDKGFDEHYLTKIFSSGNLGRTGKKLVPTRWSITAVDDTLGKDMIREVKDYKVNDYEFYFGGYLGNYYIILLFPEIWSYELFETYVKTKEFTTDYEGYYGRKSYAINTVGGYYAARFSILQKLTSIKRQATVLALRFITDEYWAPLGVWVVREASKKAMSSKPLKFDDQSRMMKYAEEFIKKEYGFDLNTILKQSNVMKNQKQKKINEY